MDAYRYCGRHCWTLPCHECAREAQVAALEAQVRDLLARLAALEALTPPREALA